MSKCRHEKLTPGAEYASLPCCEQCGADYFDVLEELRGEKERYKSALIKYANPKAWRMNTLGPEIAKEALDE